MKSEKSEKSENDNVKASKENITANTNSTWSVYILMRDDHKLYTGITNNMPARWNKHSGNQGAKFFRGRHPIALCYQEPDHSRSSASQREYQIKQLSRQKKRQLIIETYGPFLSTRRYDHFWCMSKASSSVSC